MSKKERDAEYVADLLARTVVDNRIIRGTTQTKVVSLKDQIKAMEEKKKVFNRKEWYSQTEACAAFDINPKEFKGIVTKYHLKTINRDVNLGGYTVKTIYVSREDFERALANEKGLK